MFLRRHSQLLCACGSSQHFCERLIEEVERSERTPSHISEAFSRSGKLAIVLMFTTKGAALILMKAILDRGWPVLAVVDTRITGLNRLSPEDESAFLKPKRWTQDFALPLEQLDPLIFPPSWKDIARLASPLVSWAVLASSDGVKELRILKERGGKEAQFVWGGEGSDNRHIQVEKETACMGAQRRACRRLSEGVVLYGEEKEHE